jgi:hypothetical protein
MRSYAAPLVLLGLLACQRPDPSPSAGAPAPTPLAPPPAPALPIAPPPLAEPIPTQPEEPAAPALTERPMYYERAILPADLEGRSLRELTLLRNTIYARIGQRFRKQWLIDYFHAQPWYQPRESVDESTLSELDLKNAEAIVDYEATFTPAQLRDARERINERMRGEALGADDTVEFQLIAARLGEWQGGDEIDASQRSPLEDPDRLDQLLTVEHLADLSLRDLRLLRNTIYARRGRLFRSTLLRDHFGAMAWYAPVDDFSDAKLTAIDRKNIRLIKSVEADNGGPITDWGHKVEEGWFYGA